MTICARRTSFFEAGYLSASAQARSAPANHKPAMVRECLRYLNIRPDGCYVDGTCGCGGHSLAIAERVSRPGTLLCLDLDLQMVEYTRQRLQDARCRVLVRHASFADLPEVLLEESLSSVDGILLDLGVCSAQLDDPGHGFSFRLEGPLQMLYDPERGVPAADLANHRSEAELAALFHDLAQEKHARAIAHAIVARRRHRPFKTTTDLAETIANAVPARERHARLHPATRAFLALRVAANDEVGHLRRALERVPFLLAPGGRLVILCYESLEDQEVKRAFRRFSGYCICPPRTPVCTCGAGRLLRVLTPKAARPSTAEVAANPRARSVRLRAAERRVDQ